MIVFIVNGAWQAWHFLEVSSDFVSIHCNNGFSFYLHSLWDAYFLLSWTAWCFFPSTCLDTAVWWANVSDTSILLYCTALSVSYCASGTKPDKKGTNRRDRFICSVMLNLSHISFHRNNMLWPENHSLTYCCSMFILKLYFPLTAPRNSVSD